jgi:hypothetical protein
VCLYKKRREGKLSALRRAKGVIRAQWLAALPLPSAPNQTSIFAETFSAAYVGAR